MSNRLPQICFFFYDYKNLFQQAQQDWPLPQSRQTLPEWSQVKLSVAKLCQGGNEQRWIKVLASYVRLRGFLSFHFSGSSEECFVSLVSPCFPFPHLPTICLVSDIPNEKNFCIPLGETDYLDFMLGGSGGLRVW